jgi:hypothetical protein
MLSNQEFNEISWTVALCVLRVSPLSEIRKFKEAYALGSNSANLG